jgi:acetolactate synthase-1/2/3 large subunit
MPEGFSRSWTIFSMGGFPNPKWRQNGRGLKIFNGKTIATDLSNPDFVMYAKSFGAAARQAETPEALREAIRVGFDADQLLLQGAVMTLP